MSHISSPSPILAVSVAVLAALLMPGTGEAQSEADSTNGASAQDSTADGSPGAPFRHISRTDADGSDRSMIITSAANGSAALGWQCTGTGLRVFVALDRHYVGNEDDDILVRWRVPATAATDSSGLPTAGDGFWRLAGTGTVAWMRIGDIAVFTRAALAADSVALQLTDPFDNEDRSDAFALTGLAAALDRLPCELRRESRPGG